MPETSTRASMAPADIPARMAARAIDVIVLVVVSGLLGQGIGFGFDWLLLTATLVIVYFALSDALLGATLRKFALRLRVYGPEGNRPTLLQSLAREAFTLIGAIPFIGPVLALAAWTWIILSIRSSPVRQGKHDLLAGGTRVVRLGRPASH